MSEAIPHIPVMGPQAIDALAVREGGVYVDATLGAGGYSKAILQEKACRLFAFDRDPTAIARAREWAGDFADRLVLIEQPFSALTPALKAHGVTAVDGVVADIGVSSMQLDEAERGFSFRQDGPLSMRMDGAKPDAADLVSVASEDDLTAILKFYGEERHARRIARRIIRARMEAPILTTRQLAALVEEAVPTRPQDKIHPATRSFQAIRIFVNNELGQLAELLRAAERLLRPTGRLVVVNFHSLEDRLVKRFFASRTAHHDGGSRHLPRGDERVPSFRQVGRKPLRAGEEEIAANPRARSATMRVGERTTGPPLDDDTFCFPALRLSPTLAPWSHI